MTNVTNIFKNKKGKPEKPTPKLTMKAPKGPTKYVELTDGEIKVLCHSLQERYAILAQIVGHYHEEKEYGDDLAEAEALLLETKLVCVRLLKVAAR
jgi:hypothetical protein